jgi:hypothetical protein
LLLGASRRQTAEERTSQTRTADIAVKNQSNNKIE